jgi:uncharacterized membrane protein
VSPAPRVPLGVGLFAGAIMAVGVLHFVAPRPFDAIIPRALPAEARRPLTYASGAAEIACGALMAVPRTRRLGGRLTTVLLLAVWPANIDAALRGGYPGLAGFAGSAAAAWLRVPLQLPLIWWALRIARGARGTAD